MKMRPSRASLEVSTISGSPIAASSRSGALAYIIGIVAARLQIFGQRHFRFAPRLEGAGIAAKIS